MTDLILRQGQKVTYKGQLYDIHAPVDLGRVLLKSSATGEQIYAKISELQPACDNSKLDARKNITDLVLISDEDWEKARRREAALAPLINEGQCSLAEAKQIASQLNLSWRQVYNLLKRYHDYDHQLLALIPQKSTGGKGKTRIKTITDQIINEVVEEKFLSPQKTKVSLVFEEIKRCCVTAGITPPSERTVRRRIDDFSQKIIEKSRSARHISKKYVPIVGSFPSPESPHKIWQIDHTPVDLIVVDDVFRKPIGRPYLTLAIDTYSRCIPGFCLALDEPSTVSVGLCLTHSVFDKEEWLSQRGINTQWPIWGKPECIYLDNAPEFHSEALKRGCEAHGIKIVYRPPGQPHYGGIIERVIGTFMQLVHSLPGTTFSNVEEKGDYPSDKKAVLTLSELEYWLTLAITDYYHQKVHTGINQPPIEQYRSAILGDENKTGIGYPTKIYNKQAFLIDFLPIEWRSIQRHGFILDHIFYNSLALSPFIADRKKYRRFLIRRDPRDLSRIYVLEPHSQRYLEVPYRTLSRPTITLWEHKRAVSWLHEKGLYRMNETLIFQAIARMREIVKNANKKTKSARRQQARTNNHINNVLSMKREAIVNNRLLPTDQPKIDQKIDENTKIVQPFEDIEVW